jgi:hypothetical protein
MVPGAATRGAGSPKLRARATVEPAVHGPLDSSSAGGSMNKLLLLTGLVAPVVIAILNARSRSAPRALRRVLIQYCLVNLVYVATLVVLFRYAP